MANAWRSVIQSWGKSCVRGLRRPLDSQCFLGPFMLKYRYPQSKETSFVLCLVRCWYVSGGFETLVFVDSSWVQNPKVYWICFFLGWFVSLTMYCWAEWLHICLIFDVFVLNIFSFIYPSNTLIVSEVLLRGETGSNILPFCFGEIVRVMAGRVNFSGTVLIQRLYFFFLSKFWFYHLVLFLFVGVLFQN